jgi:hypothetical protein
MISAWSARSPGTHREGTSLGAVSQADNCDHVEGAVGVTIAPEVEACGSTSGLKWLGPKIALPSVEGASSARAQTQRAEGGRWCTGARSACATHAPRQATTGSETSLAPPKFSTTVGSVRTESDNL